MQKRYWLRGGVILGILSLVCGYAFNTVNTADFPLLDVLYFPVLVVVISFSLFDPQMQFVIFFVYGFIIGSILGWIYGKIKNRNKIVI